MKNPVFIVLVIIFTCFQAYAQEYNDIITLRSGKKVRGRIITTDSLKNTKIETQDKFTIIVNQDEIVKLEHQLHSNAQIFNFPVGTKFISKIKSENLSTTTTSVYEILDIKGNAMTMKTSSSTGGIEGVSGIAKWYLEDSRVLISGENRSLHKK